MTLLDDLKAQLSQLQANLNRLLDGLAHHRPPDPTSGDVVIAARDLQGLIHIIQDLNTSVAAVAAKVLANGGGLAQLPGPTPPGPTVSAPSPGSREATQTPDTVGSTPPPPARQTPPTPRR